MTPYGTTGNTGTPSGSAASAATRSGRMQSTVSRRWRVLLGAAERQHRAVVVPQVLLHLHPVHVGNAHVGLQVRGSSRSPADGGDAEAAAHCSRSWHSLPRIAHVTGRRRGISKAHIMNTRRQFLLTAPLGVLAATSACGTPGAIVFRAQRPRHSSPRHHDPGAPPTFGTGPVTGPPVSAATFAEAEKLVQVTMRPADRELAASSWQRSLAPLLERRAGPAQGRARRRGRRLPRSGRRRSSTPVPRRRATRSCAAAPAPTPLPGKRCRHRVRAGD